MPYFCLDLRFLHPCYANLQQCLLYQRIPSLYLRRKSLPYVSCDLALLAIFPFYAFFFASYTPCVICRGHQCPSGEDNLRLFTHIGHEHQQCALETAYHVLFGPMSVYGIHSQKNTRRGFSINSIHSRI